MTSSIEQDAILNELASLVGIPGIGGSYSEQEAREEIDAILNAYDGDLPSANARAIYQRVGAAGSEEPACSEAFLEIWYPAPYAESSGTATMVVPTALVLRLFAATLDRDDPDGPDVARILAAAEYFEATPQAAPLPRPYRERLAKMTANEGAVAELLAMAAARPASPMRNAVPYLEFMARLNKDVREGRDFHRELVVVCPAHFHACGPGGGFIPVADVLTGLAKHLEQDDPSETARLRDLVDTHYIHDVEIDVDLPDDPFTLVEIDPINLEEARLLLLENISVPLPGSMSLHPSTDSSSYSPDSDEHPYRLFLLRHEDNDDTCLLIGPDRAYYAFVDRPA